MPMLEVRDLRVAYGKIEAVKGISFSVVAGPRLGRALQRQDRRRSGRLGHHRRDGTTGCGHDARGCCC